LVVKLFLDSSAPAALRQIDSCCGWFRGLRPLNEPQQERKNEPRSGEKSKIGIHLMQRDTQVRVTTITAALAFLAGEAVRAQEHTRAEISI